MVMDDGHITKTVYSKTLILYFYNYKNSKYKKIRYILFLERIFKKRICNYNIMYYILFVYLPEHIATLCNNIS